MQSVTPLAREMYTIREAAHLLALAPSTLRWWLEGSRGRKPVLRPEPTGSSNVTWGEFIEGGLLKAYRRKAVPLPRLRAFVDQLRHELGVPYPLAHHRPFVGEGRRLLLQAQAVAGIGNLVYDVQGGQIVLDGQIEAFVDRVDWAPAGHAERLYPAGRTSPVVIDPAVGFGAPTVNGIRTDALAELIEAGEDVDEVAEIYGLPVATVKAATSWEWRTGAVPIAA